MSPTMFSDLAGLFRALESTRRRKEKVGLLVDFLRRLEPGEVPAAVLLVVGSVFPEFDPRTLEVGYATVKRVMEDRGQTTLLGGPLTLGEVHETLGEVARISGPGSRHLKEELLKGLFRRLLPEEAEVLVRILFGEVRIGVSEGMMLEGIAGAAAADPALVRRALMLTGDLGEVARTALGPGEEGLRRLGVRVFVPLKPMLAAMSHDTAEVLEEHGGRTSLEHKFDGARIQIHRLDDEVRVYSRRMTEVTDSLPDIVELVRERIPAKNLILEGETVAIGGDGRPLPFQNLMRRFTRVHEVAEMAARIPLRLHLFDILHLDGRPLVDEPFEARRRILEEVCPRDLLSARMVASDAAEVEAFLRRALEEGHEGLMAKRLDSRYTPGVRGRGWYKIKPAETLDLVVAAADWGYGRRTGWLSNYHLAARDGGEFRVIGKTFKGLTDEEFEWMTRRLQELKVSETGQTVHVRPGVVVEVDFNEIQRSPRYPSGFALRFARVKRIRHDKAPEQVDTLERVREFYERQFHYKAKAQL